MVVVIVLAPGQGEAAVNPNPNLNPILAPSRDTEALAVLKSGPGSVYIGPKATPLCGAATIGTDRFVHW